MKINIISFTKTGYDLSEKLKELLSDDEVCLLYKGSAEGPVREELSLNAICKNAFEEKTALLFIGATGIAVRHIAPFLKDKLSDPPVLVMDEKAIHVIPLLSGHVGGANELALKIAEEFGADPVITTATDLNRTFSVDLFAKQRGLKITNRRGIAPVSAKALEGKPVVLSIKDYPPKEQVDVVVTNDKEVSAKAVLTLSPADDAAATSVSLIMDESKKDRYFLGIGCKKDKPAEDIEAVVLKVLETSDIKPENIAAVGTIDIKIDEKGLLEFTKKYSLPLIAFDKDLLSKAEGDFSHSDFVKETTGVDNVCERAAILVAGSGARLVVNKTTENGVAVAVAVAASKIR